MDLQDEDEKPRRRRSDIREDVELAVSVAIRQSMTSYQLRVERIDQEVEKLRFVVFGDAQTDQAGLVKQVRTLVERLDTVIEQRRSTLVLLRGVAAGLALNLLASAPEIIKVIKSIIGAIP